MRLIRAFEHGLDPTSSEAGFVLVHVDMVKNSGPLVDGAVWALDACAADDREAFELGMQRVVEALVKVNQVMDGMYSTICNARKVLGSIAMNEIDMSRGMWKKSKPGAYSFRTFIFGITSQSMFPMAWCMKASPKNRWPLEARVVRMIAWYDFDASNLSN
jgi:indoleamine 2,3-dioxygenase